MENKSNSLFKIPSYYFRKLYSWTKDWAKSRHASLALFCIAFVESSFFLVPPDVLLTAMVVANRKRWFQHALICTIGSVCGALLGYLIGWVFYDTLGRWIIAIYHIEDKVIFLAERYRDNAFWVVFTAAFTPIPYKAITITAGLFKIPLFILVSASLIGRAGRFFLVAATLRIFGKKIESSIEKNFDIFSILFVLLLIGGFLLLKVCFK